MSDKHPFVVIPPPVFASHSFRDNLNLFGVHLPFQSNYFYLVFILVGGALFVAHRLHHSRVGLTWNAIREDEIAARCQGIDVTRYKILAFCIDAFFGGVAGTVYAHYIGFISPENFAFIVSVVVVTMVILGGMDNVFGVIIGAILLTIIPENFRAFEDFRLLIYGVIVVTMLMFRPQGLFPQKLRSYSPATPRGRWEGSWGGLLLCRPAVAVVIHAAPADRRVVYGLYHSFLPPKIIPSSIGRESEAIPVGSAYDRAEAAQSCGLISAFTCYTDRVFLHLAVAGSGGKSVHSGTGSSGRTTPSASAVE